MKVDKGRYWACIGWDESLPENWLKKLKDSTLPIIVSPHHDSDIDEDTGEIQKPHYHIILCWDGPVPLGTVRTFAEELGLGSYVERVRSMNNILNYLTHDSYKGRGKTNYSVEDIQYINCKESDFVQRGYAQIVEYVRANNIVNIGQLINRLYDECEYELLEYVSKNTYYVHIYISSLKQQTVEEFKECYNLLKGYAEEIDRRGKFTLDRVHYCKLLEVFEQLDIYAEDI